MSYLKQYIHTSFSTMGKKHRAIVVIGPLGTIPDRLKAGLERELPWIILCEVETIEQACRTFPETVSLILLHPDAAAHAERSAPQLHRFHPLALIGLLQPDAASAQQTRTLVTSSKMWQGLVPLGAKVHEFVTIISFMLRGGQYFPPEMFFRPSPAPSPALAEAKLAETPTPKAAFRTDLTRRELEILELVSRGLQNKSIAAQLTLSEFTVKIHLHNIITKLGARNRTEAAAFFRDGRQPEPLASSLVN